MMTTVETKVQLSDEILQWAQQKPGGLSDLVSRLLQDAYAEEEEEAKWEAKWEASFAATTDEQIEKMAQRVDEDIKAGRVTPLDFTNR